MCTAVRYDNFFGRNLDVYADYGEEPCRTPSGQEGNIYSILGMGIREGGQTLYFDAVNEKGLAMAGLSFCGYACYKNEIEGMKNIPSYRLISYILGCCADIRQALELLPLVNVTAEAVSQSYSPAPLHWMLADRFGSVVIEAVEQGVRIYKNTVDVLTNAPDFEKQKFNLNNYIALGSDPPQNRFPLPLYGYSLGMGAMGLPGDPSSMSRFVRCAFHLHSSPRGLGYHQLLSILATVSMPMGSVITEKGECEYTRYSCCYDLSCPTLYLSRYNSNALTELLL